MCRCARCAERGGKYATVDGRDPGSATEPATRASEKLRADLKPRTKPAPRATSDSRASPTPCASRKGARRGQDRPAWPGPRFRRSTARPIEKSALHSRRRVRRWRAESAPGVPAGICGETCASAWPGTRPSPCMRQRAPLHAGVERSCCARSSATSGTDRSSPSPIAICIHRGNRAHRAPSPPATSALRLKNEDGRTKDEREEDPEGHRRGKRNL